jgi:NAD(P)-dependent dehydrogenase (short-subunit alcohol dehydrogenase family)
LKDLLGKSVLIVGGTTGIGRATAIAFAKAGCRLLIAGRSKTSGDETLKLLSDIGVDAKFISADVRNEHDVQGLVESCVRHYGRLDCAINNAGIEGEGVLLTETTEVQWNELIDINLKGTYLGLKYELVQMLKQRSGCIVNTSSVLGVVANRSAIYTASKHGVNGLTKSAALSFADKGIRVNAVCPGYVRTPMLNRAYSLNPDAEQNAISRHPMGRLCTPEEVAEAIVWLCSDNSSFVTGHFLTVDGGYTIP